MLPLFNDNRPSGFIDTAICIFYNSGSCWTPFCFASHVTQTEFYLFTVTVFV